MYLLWLEELAVRLELEEEVGDVGEQHDDAAGAGELEAGGGRGHGVLAGADGVAQQQRQRLAQRAQDEEPRAHVRLVLQIILTHDMRSNQMSFSSVIIQTNHGCFCKRIIY